MSFYSPLLGQRLGQGTNTCVCATTKAWSFHLLSQRDAGSVVTHYLCFQVGFIRKCSLKKNMKFPSKSKAKPCKHAISLKWPHLTPCLESSHLAGPTEMNFWVTHAAGNALSFFTAQLWHFRKSKPSQIPLLAPAWIPCLPRPLGLPLPSGPCCSSFLLFLRFSPFSDCFPTPNGNLSLEDSICHHFLDEKKNTVPSIIL